MMTRPLTNANMADYLVDAVEIGYRCRARGLADAEIGAGCQGAGEAGTAGAAAAVNNAVNDALRPFGVTITEIPLTPQVILSALGRI